MSLYNSKNILNEIDVNIDELTVNTLKVNGVVNTTSNITTLSNITGLNIIANLDFSCNRYLDSNFNTLIGAGSIPLNGSFVTLTSTVINTSMTLSNGQFGQHITLVSGINSTQSLVITPGNKHGYTTITLPSYGKSVSLVYMNIGWYITGHFGAVIV